MPWLKKSKAEQGAERVVRHVRPDGTVKEYRYAAYKAKPLQPPAENLSKLIDDYKDSPDWRSFSKRTKANFVIYLRPLGEIGTIDPRTLDRPQVFKIRDSIALVSGNGAANYFVTCTRQLYKWAIDRGRAAVNPATDIKKLAIGHLLAWSQEHADIALAALPEALRRAVVLAMYTGQRRGDLCRMAWRQYDGSRVRLTQEKTDTPLVIPCHPDLRAELEAWKVGAPQVGTILLNAHGRPWQPEALSQMMKAGLGRIKVPEGQEELPPNLNIHGLRKLAASNLAEAGCSTKEIAAITGHETLAMIELYTKSADQKRLATAAIHRLQTFTKLTNEQKIA